MVATDSGGPCTKKCPGASGYWLIVRGRQRNGLALPAETLEGSKTMNFWKPVALCAIGALVVSVGTQIALAEGACRNQVNMATALEHFRQARASLERAEHNKGGWRERAIQAADTAIRETNAGCAFADTH